MEETILSFIFAKPYLTALVVIELVIIACIALAYFNAIPVRGNEWYLTEKSFKVKAKKGKWLVAIHRKLNY